MCTKHVGSGFVGVLIWVDDLIIAASNMLLMSEAEGEVSYERSGKSFILFEYSF